MSNGVIIAIIGAVPALVTAIVSVYLNNRVLNVKIESLQKQFDKMETKIDKHNQVVERIAILERDNKSAFNKIEENRNDISNLRDHVMQQA